SQRGRDRSSRAVDVQVDFLIAVFVLQIEQLLNRDVRQVVGDSWVTARFRRASQEHNAIFQEEIAQRHLPLAHVFSKALNLRLKGPAAGVQFVHGWVLFLCPSSKACGTKDEAPSRVFNSGFREPFLLLPALPSGPPFPLARAPLSDLSSLLAR